jgi:hypothetical protein
MRYCVVLVGVAAIAAVGCGDNEVPALDTVITNGPNGVVTDPTSMISFAAVPDDDATYSCAFDSTTFTACSSPMSVTGVDGAHTFAVRATNSDGETDPTPATLAWTINAAGPSLDFTQTPAAISSVLTPTFAFESADPTATFECQVDGVIGYTPCTSPFTTPTLGEGLQSFQLRATNAADSTSTLSFAWTIDTAVPDVTITGKPVNPTNNDTPQFAFTTSGNTTLVQCRMDSEPTISPCVSGVAIGPLAAGAHTFTVTAFDNATPPNTGSESYTFVVGTCGDGVAEGTEDCDGSDLVGQTCFGLGYTTGTLACSATCTFDTTGCTTCGNNVIEAGEFCDADQVGSATCASVGGGFNDGTLVCNNTCTGYSTEFCGTCGNGVVENTEQCDGSDTAGLGCPDLGFTAGTLACNADCTYDTSQCSTCGNDVIEGTEACDDQNLVGQSCATLGFTSGTLLCSTDCTAFDTDQCDTCGNGMIDGLEACDGSNMNGATCNGTLACNSDCTFDTSQCDGGFVADTSGFSATRVCNDGFALGPPQNTGNPDITSFTELGLCTEDAGPWLALIEQQDSFGLAYSATAPAWTNQEGQHMTSVHGASLWIQSGNATGTFLTTNATGSNAFRSNGFVTPGSPNWTATAFTERLFAQRTGGSTNNYIGGWDPATGLAVVLHGNFAATATKIAIDDGSVDGTPITGTVTSIATGAASLPATDIHVAVYGAQPSSDTSSQPDGAAATGGIYWTCDNGATYVEHDTGIAATDRPLVYKIAVDVATFSSANRTCPTTGMATAQVTATMYAGLLGGGSLYKTTDGGNTWALANTGLPANVSVYAIAVDCGESGATSDQCADDQLVYAATSQGLYESVDGAAHWNVLGFGGHAVRALAISPGHPVGQRPRIFVGVDDAHVIYDRNVGDAVPQ